MTCILLHHGGRLRHVALPLTCAFALSACQPQTPERFADRFTTVEEQEFADAYLRLMQHGAVDSAYALLIPELKKPGARDDLRQAAVVLATHPPVERELIGVQVNVQDGRRSVNLSWQYPTQGQWVLTNVAAVHSSGSSQVYGIRAWVSPTSLTQMHDFTFRGKALRHYIWLGLLIINPLVCLYAAHRAIRARGLPKRWLWAFASLFGVFAFSLDWTTGAMSMNPFSFYVLGVAALRGGPAAPWIVTVSFPLGAMLLLGRYRAWRSSSPTNSDDVQQSVPAV